VRRRPAPSCASPGTISLISECAGGEQPASPTPTPILSSNSWAKFCAIPHNAVIADQIVSATPIIVARLVAGRSA